MFSGYLFDETIVSLTRMHSANNTPSLTELPLLPLKDFNARPTTSIGLQNNHFRADSVTRPGHLFEWREKSFSLSRWQELETVEDDEWREKRLSLLKVNCLLVGLDTRIVQQVSHRQVSTSTRRHLPSPMPFQAAPSFPGKQCFCCFFIHPWCTATTDDVR